LSGKNAWPSDQGMADENFPGWMIELAEQVGMIEAGELGGLPRGVIVGRAETGSGINWIQFVAKLFSVIFVSL
jgi:hypothetical protein